MANIVNLGQFGPPRESVLAPVRRGVEAGAKSYMEGVKDKATLQVALAESTRKQTEANRKNAYKLLEDMSMYVADKSPEEVKAYMQTDMYKGPKKLMKKYLDEYIDDDTGEIMFLKTKDIYSTKLERHKANIADKLARGEQLAPAELKLKDFLDKVDVRVAATAIDMASKDYRWKIATETEKAKMVQEALQLLQKTRGNIYTDNLAGEQTGGDEADPLGILK